LCRMRINSSISRIATSRGTSSRGRTAIIAVLLRTPTLP
jgi:hypothetical protein